jgi:ABC-type multidrug transport system fused ATPase/permease subunit
MEISRDNMSFNTLFNLFFAIAAFATVFFIGYIRKILKQRNTLFVNAETTTGTVLSVARKQSLSLPIIEYENNGKTIQFTSAVTAETIKEGQTVELQIAADGTARIKSSVSNFMLHILSASMILFFVLGCLFIYDKFL